MNAPPTPGPIVAASRDISRRSAVVGLGFTAIAAAFAAAATSSFSAYLANVLNIPVGPAGSPEASPPA